MSEEVTKKIRVYIIQVAFVGILFECLIGRTEPYFKSARTENSGFQGVDFSNVHQWAPIIARYVVYILLIRGSQELSGLLYNQHFHDEQIDFLQVYKANKRCLVIFSAALFFLFYVNAAVFKGEDFLRIYIAILISDYPEIEKTSSPMINYGVGMACSFFEGYLTHVIPSDGAKFVGFEENINAYESKEGIVFPVKRLFIIIPKNLFSPPDLKFHNKMDDESLPYIEAAKSMMDVNKDVAGVKDRIYRNSAYKLKRRDGPPVYIAAEFATPLHTLHRVLDRRALYDELCDVDVPRIVRDFCRQLEQTIRRSPECRDKCVLVHFDETKENLATVLLNKIAEIAPNFEELIRREPQ